MESLLPRADVFAAFRKYARQLRYLGEAALAYPLYGLVAALPLDAASWLGGFLARWIGPWMPMHKVAVRNLTRILPEQTPLERRRTLAKMWDNFGRVLAEYAHLDELLDGGRIDIIGAELLDRLAAANDRAVFMGGHFGNWEIAPPTIASRGVRLAVAYRQPNNRMVGRLVGLERRRGSNLLLMPKGPDGARGLLKHLLAGGSIGLLVDQKMNDGIPVPFFGIETMTAAAGVRLATKSRCKIILVHSERLKGAHFRIAFSELRLAPETEADERGVMLEVHRHFEDWIRADPGQWLWLHNRWRD